ncbi:two-component system sensor histidine kinase NtrB [Bacillus suaedaesalsae]|uniref:histidine kinase n=1 Tax=Bacillus suaedaesalsae TaxID=2810349 RepID=A0ABS2DNM0_9BACI|nr:ATP-binding protein [Bacillus suaedaesalsae]MBM6619151.1 sensor histidine kinase [Bacillus suaedaesalsae]
MSKPEKMKFGTILYVSLTALFALTFHFFHLSIPELSYSTEMLFFLLLSLSFSIILLNKYIILLPPRGTNLSTDSTIYLASIFTLGIEMTLAVLCLSSIILAIVERRFELWKHLFNFSIFTIMIVGSYYTYIFLGGEVGTLNLYTTHAYLSTLIIYFILNVLLISIHYYIVSPNQVMAIITGFLKESASHYFVVLALSLILAILLDTVPIMGIILFTFVVLLFSLILRQYHLLYDQVTNDTIYREQIFNSLPVGSIIYDERVLTYTLNETAKHILDLTAAELDTLVKRKQTIHNKEFWDVLLLNKKIQNKKVYYTNGENTYLLLVSQSDLHDQFNMSVGRIVTFTDITEIEQLEKRIYQSEKLAILGEISAKAAHEIRNPLTVIYGFLTLMKQSFSDNDRERYQIPLMLTEFERINSIIDEMLSMAQPQMPTLVECYIEDVVEDVLTLHRQISSKSIKFEVKLDRVPLFVDKRQMTQVLYNLIRNSSEAIDCAGTVSIYSKVTHDSYQLFIKDDGSGIPFELQRTIFEPFLTSKDSGTGLGLTIVQRIIENHGGTIELYESSKNGTTFLICILIGKRKLV